jgi:hypothetical protein
VLDLLLDEPFGDTVHGKDLGCSRQTVVQRPGQRQAISAEPVNATAFWFCTTKAA